MRLRPPRLAGCRKQPSTHDWSERAVRPRGHSRLSWSDPVFRAIVWQVAIVGAVVLIVWYLIGNSNRNLSARHIATGFGFLQRVAGIPIGESPIAYDPAVNTYGMALIIGILNTLRVAAVGIVLATLLGTLIGIGRLSGNWLMAKLTACYVETLRDIPVLLQLFFWDPDPSHVAGAPSGLAHRSGAVSLQPRRKICRIGVGSCLYLGRVWICSRRCRHHYLGCHGSQTPGDDRTTAAGLAGRPGADRRSSAGDLGPAGCAVSPRYTRAARLQFPGRRSSQSRVFRLAPRPGDLHGCLHRRDCAIGHSGDFRRPVGGRRRTRTASRDRALARSCCRRRCA